MNADPREIARKLTPEDQDLLARAADGGSLTSDEWRGLALAWSSDDWGGGMPIESLVHLDGDVGDLGRTYHVTRFGRAVAAALREPAVLREEGDR